MWAFVSWHASQGWKIVHRNSIQANKFSKTADATGTGYSASISLSTPATRWTFAVAPIDAPSPWSLFLTLDPDCARAPTSFVPDTWGRIFMASVLAYFFTPLIQMYPSWELLWNFFFHAHGFGRIVAGDQRKRSTTYEGEITLCCKGQKSSAMGKRKKNKEKREAAEKLAADWDSRLRKLISTELLLNRHWTSCCLSCDCLSWSTPTRWHGNLWWM